MVKKDIVSHELRSILKEDGVLTAHAVVDRARDPESPLHPLFDWDNDQAAEKYRLWQARQVIGSQKVTIQNREVKEYYNLRIVEEGELGNSYTTIEQVLSDDMLYKQALGIALRDLEGWKQKYENLRDLEGVVSAKAIRKVKKIVQGDAPALQQ